MNVTRAQLLAQGFSASAAGTIARAAAKPKRRRAKVPTKFVPFAVKRTDAGVEITMPIQLKSEANQREHWRKRKARKFEQQRAFGLLIGQAHPFPSMPLTITFTRLGPVGFDKDNLAGSFKHVQDAMARTLGVDDGPDDSRVEWNYRQAQSAAYGARFLIEARTCVSR